VREQQLVDHFLADRGVGYQEIESSHGASMIARADGSLTCVKPEES
jgi:hypothetical protein